MYAKFNGDGVRPIDVPNAGESKRFWGDLWSIGQGHNQEAEWLKDSKNELVGWLEGWRSRLLDQEP